MTSFPFNPHSQTLVPALAASVAVTALALASLPAQARPDTRSMNCVQAQAFIQQNGAVVMSTGPYTYSRFVADRRYCPHYEILKPNYGPTRDNPECPVGYRCERVVHPDSGTQ